MPEPTITEEGVCEWLLREQPAGHRPALFLDRDGVIVDEVHYLHRPEDASLVPGIAELISTANAKSIPVVVVSNQSGIGRGMYGWDDFIAVQREIDRLLAARGAVLDAVFACPFHRDAEPPYDVDDHPDRKPNPGMLLRAARLLDIDLARSWFVGDTVVDIEAAAAAGLAGAVHVLTGHGCRDRQYLDLLDPNRLRLIRIDQPSDALSMVPLFR